MNLERIRNILAHRIRFLRNSRGWTQERLAEQIDVHPTYISRIESGNKFPTLVIICKIADALGVDAHELLIDEKKINTSDYKRKKIISILNESKATKVDVYSRILNALDRK